MMDEVTSLIVVKYRQGLLKNMHENFEKVATRF